MAAAAAAARQRLSPRWPRQTLPPTVGLTPACSVRCWLGVGAGAGRRQRGGTGGGPGGRRRCREGGGGAGGTPPHGAAAARAGASLAAARTAAGPPHPRRSGGTLVAAGCSSGEGAGERPRDLPWPPGVRPPRRWRRPPPPWRLAGSTGGARTRKCVPSLCTGPPGWRWGTPRTVCLGEGGAGRARGAGRAG